MSATRKNHSNTSEVVLYMAMELSENAWKLGFSTGMAQKPRRRDMTAKDVEALRAEVAAAKERFDLPADARVVSCYEAGRDGFWLHRRPGRTIPWWTRRASRSIAADDMPKRTAWMSRSC
jgi:hypothetical protein